jgi:uncharacterized membrane protein
MTLLFAFLIGLFAGFRSLTAPAMVAWAVYLGWLTLTRPLSLIGTLPAVIILSVLAVTEIIFDKLPTTPSRTAPPGLIARIIMGALAGACIAVNGGKGIAIGALLGAAGGIVVTFVGYQVRRRVVSNLNVPDFYVAIVEDLITLGGCLWIVSRG